MVFGRILTVATATCLMLHIFTGCNAQGRSQQCDLQDQRGSANVGASQVAADRSYFVAVGGDDSNDGSLDKPFATLRRAAAAMRAGAIKATYVREGAYTLSSTIVLGAGNSGDSILGYPGEESSFSAGNRRLASLVLIHDVHDLTISGLTFSSGGAGGALALARASHNTITHNHFHNNIYGVVLGPGASNNIVSDNQIVDSDQSAIEVRDGSNGNIFDGNLIDGTGALGTAGGGFFLHGVRNNEISHNLIEHTAGLGIGVLNWNRETVNIGNIIAYNMVRDTNTAPGSIDSGAIYVLGRSQIDTRMIIRGNMVLGTGAPHPAHTVGIYLDDLTSGVVVRDNIVTGVGSDGMQIHGGQDNTITNNVIDTGTGVASAILIQAAPADTNPKIAMTNNVISQNIIYSSSKTPKIYVYYSGGTPLISGNLYFNTTGASMATHAPADDLQPRFADPDFLNAEAHDYTISATTSTSSGVGFQPIDQNCIGPMHLTSH